MSIFKKKLAKATGSTFDKNFGSCYLPGISDAETAFISAEFDASADYDVYSIGSNIKKAELISSVCLIKLITYPLEYLLTKSLLPKAWLEELREHHKLYKEYRKGDMDISKFNKEFNDISDKYAKEKVSV